MIAGQYVLAFHPPIPPSHSPHSLSFIPAGTQVYLPPYSHHRDARYWPRSPNTFIPDRWLNSTEEHTPAAFFPFSYGPANCVGKNLAMLEMRMLLCACVQQLDFELAGDLVTDPGRWERELGDYSVLVKGKLPALVTDRMR